MSGGGHRRISTALFLEHRPLKRPYEVIEALLSIDMDATSTGLKSINAYSRIFDRSRNWCRARLQEYREAADSLKNDGQFLDREGTVLGQVLDTQDARDTKGKEPSKDSLGTVYGQEKDSSWTPTPIRSRSDPEKKKTRAPREPPSEWSLKCADLLIDLLEPVPGARIPKGARERWAREMELLKEEAPELRKNGADPSEHISGAIRWALGPQNLGQEYEVVIRSGGSLREKWPKLRAAANRVESKRQPTQAEFHQQVMAKVRERTHGA